MQQQSKKLPLVAGKLLSLAKGSKSWMSPLSLPSRRLLGNHLVEKSELAAGRRIGERLHGDGARQRDQRPYDAPGRQPPFTIAARCREARFIFKRESEVKCSFDRMA